MTTLDGQRALDESSLLHTCVACHVEHLLWLQANNYSNSIYKNVCWTCNDL